MTISEKIEEMAENLNIPCYFIKRPEENEDCIVYTYTEVPSLIGDNKEYGTKYTVLFNLYCKENIEDNKKQLKNALESHGFLKKMILGTILEKNEMYNTAFQYIINLKQE